MDTIRTYVDNMFSGLPQTAQLKKVKEELLQNMLDKYDELKKEGKSENEAVGVVIAEFGNIDELLTELGISKSKPSVNLEKTATVDRKLVDEYFGESRKNNRLVGLATALCILSPVLLILGCGYNLVLPGILALFAFIAVAVAIFIVSGTKMERFDYLKNSTVILSDSLKNELRERKQACSGKALGALVAGISLCILSPVLLITLAITLPEASFDGLDICAVGSDGMLILIAVAIMLFMVAAGVYMLIAGNSDKECCDVLLEEEDYTPASKKSSKLTDIIAGIYWPVVVAAYLIWSFTLNAWAISWLLFVVAGILYGGISALISAATKSE